MIDITLDPSQQRAVDLVCATTCIVTGGPGTGKTTCLRAALDRMDRERVTYALASPTGKAAKRLAEATGREASTIHRLLKFNPAGGWGHNPANPLPCDVVVIDEASMIDVRLGAALLEAIEPGRTRLALIGDADQLPPVGEGRLFGDLIDCGDVPLARLDTLHRAAEQSWVCQNARRVIRGELPSLDQRDDFLFIERDQADDIVPTLRKFVTEYAPKHIDDDLQVLIPQRTGPAGIDLANVRLQDALNPRKDGETYFARGEIELRPGDRVMQTRNDYTLEVFNGEIGDVVEVGKAGLQVQYPDRAPVAYSLDQAGALQLAYALTIHKSQGSEWPWVVVVCHSTHSYMLTRHLLYTGITRARKGVVVIGNVKGLRAATELRDPPTRNTALIERMRGEL